MYVYITILTYIKHRLKNKRWQITQHSFQVCFGGVGVGSEKVGHAFEPPQKKENVPLSFSTNPLSIFSSAFSFSSSASSLDMVSFAFSISCLRIVTPSWYVEIFFLNFSLATFPASQHVFGHLVFPSYSSLPSQQSAQLYKFSRLKT